MPVTADGGGDRPPVLLTVDLEDWHQLVGRALGARGWDEPHPEFERQAGATLALLRSLGVRATFFVLGMTARHHPGVIERIAAGGHELACHGSAHVRIWEQSRAAFRRDVEDALAVLDGIGASPPAGFRAPAFSLTSRTAWAFSVLEELGFRYDSSQYDSARIPARLPAATAPYSVEVAPGRMLWELPVAATRIAGRAPPIGGGSYWRAVPRAVVLRGLERLADARSFPVVYVHPYELGSEALRVRLAPRSPVRRRAVAAWYCVRYNSGRSRVAALLADAAERFALLPCGDALPDVERVHGSSSRPLPGESSGV